MKGKLFKIAFRLSVVIIGISFLLFFGGGCTPSPVSTGSVQGVVTDNQSSEPLAGVLISAGNVTTTSDASGNYILNKVPIGDREITAVIEGYSSQSETVEIIENEITGKRDYRIGFPAYSSFSGKSKSGDGGAVCCSHLSQLS